MRVLAPGSPETGTTAGPSSRWTVPSPQSLPGFPRGSGSPFLFVGLTLCQLARSAQADARASSSSTGRWDAMALLLTGVGVSISGHASFCFRLREAPAVILAGGWAGPAGSRRQWQVTQASGDTWCLFGKGWCPGQGQVLQAAGRGCPGGVGPDYTVDYIPIST